MSGEVEVYLKAVVGVGSGSEDIFLDGYVFENMCEGGFCHVIEGVVVYCDWLVVLFVYLFDYVGAVVGVVFVGACVCGTSCCCRNRIDDDCYQKEGEKNEK